MRHAAAFAGATKMTGPATGERACEIRGASGHGETAELFDAVAKHRFLTRERHRRLELAVGKMLDSFFRTADADIFFDEVVVGRDIFVAEWPVFAEAIVRSGFEIKIAEAEGDAAPNVGPATGHSNAAHPEKGLIFRRGVRLFEIVCKPIGSVFVADTENGLHRSRFANCFQGHVAIFQFKGRFVFGEIFVGLRTTGFEKGYFQASFSQALASPSAGCAGADDNDVKFFTS